MKPITENDFSKVREYLSSIKDSQGELVDESHNSSSLHDDVVPVVDFLVRYYYAETESADNEESENAVSQKTYSLTQKEQVLTDLKENEEKFLNDYSDLLEESMQHYEADVRKQVEPILEMQVGQMTGQQLLLLLDEHHRQVRKGVLLKF
ncbi:MAG: hypothetical protein EOP45_06815 [Sphingobacteriaceae bacterium]|nr:MAG: hypothetical protein EOP45_06815 [Sphingobacteriaceae bacterium]